MKKSLKSCNRRRFLTRGAQAGVGLGFVPAAFNHLLGAETANKPSPVNPKTAKAVIYLYMFGGMTHLDTFDPKPDAKPNYRGKTNPIPSSIDGYRIGNWLPKMAKQMHHCTVINSMSSQTGAHHEGFYLMHTNYGLRGTIVHPALGAWMQVFKPADPKSKLDIPRNVVIGGPSSHPGAGFMDAKHGPLMIGSGNSGVDDVTHHGDMDDLKYRLDLAKKLDRRFQETYKQKNVKSYREMYPDALALMESEDLDVFDLDQENEKTRQSYGDGFGSGCLLARRLVERGVNFVEVYFPGWDTHNQNFLDLPRLANSLDQGMSSLVNDLHERGMLDETLVVLATEFGRTPRINQNDGRDHYPQAFSCVLAGGNVKRGHVYGKTDELAANVTDNKVDIANFNATVAYAAGLPINDVVFSPSMRPFTVGHKGEPVMDLFA